MIFIPNSETGETKGTSHKSVILLCKGRMAQLAGKTWYRNEGCSNPLSLQKVEIPKLQVTNLACFHCWLVHDVLRIDVNQIQDAQNLLRVLQGVTVKRPLPVTSGCRNCHQAANRDKTWHHSDDGHALIALVATDRKKWEDLYAIPARSNENIWKHTRNTTVVGSFCSFRSWHQGDFGRSKQCLKKPSPQLEPRNSSVTDFILGFPRSCMKQRGSTVTNGCPTTHGFDTPRYSWQVQENHLLELFWFSMSFQLGVFVTPKRNGEIVTKYIRNMSRWRTEQEIDYGVFNLFPILSLCCNPSMLSRESRRLHSNIQSIGTG